MARQLQLPDAEIDRLRIAALLHDVGKVAVPKEILEKPTALTSAEWRTVVQHPRIGQVILEHASALKDAVPIILHHHERYAGHGYPFGLRANEIPLGARIVAIADAYDAMTTDRPYKRAMSHEAAIAELRRHAGTQFDPELVESFCDLYSNEAPAPDPAVLAMIAAERRPRRSGDHGPGRAVRASGAPAPAIGRGRGRCGAVRRARGGLGHARVADDGARWRARHRGRPVSTWRIAASVRIEHGARGHVVARPERPTPGPFRDGHPLTARPRVRGGEPQ